ncbi:MAG: tetratricopeptide repeat protein [Candidatus Marinimicrobia bacterium]|nr:tetratricopeptide repeat protein [Candidatus Neomarinimicrobiota bacterium]
MNTRPIRFLILGLLLGGAVRADTIAVGARERAGDFAAAQAAYDAADWPTAAAHYRALLQDGYHEPEIWFNLGNVQARRGRWPLAIACYRQAAYLDPGDPDIEANFAYALAAADAPAPHVSIAARTLGRLSAPAWWRLLRVSLWASVLFGLLALPWRAARPTLVRLAAATLVLTALAAAGFAHWWTYRARPEFVVLAPALQVRYAPLESGAPHFAAPPRALLRVRSQAGDWLEVAAGDRTGWIPAAAGQPLSPWQAPPAQLME